MKDSEILEAAAEMVQAGYTKDAYAKNEYDWKVSVMDPNACKFCMLGAVARAAGGSIKTADALVNKWVIIPPRMVLVGYNPAGPQKSFTLSHRAWNDAPYIGQSDVVAKLREGAKLAKDRGE